MTAQWTAKGAAVGYLAMSDHGDLRMGVRSLRGTVLFNREDVMSWVPFTTHQLQPELDPLISLDLEEFFLELFLQ